MVTTAWLLIVAVAVCFWLSVWLQDLEGAMELDRIEQHSRILATGWSDARLARFLDQRVRPDGESRKVKMETLQHYIAELHARTLEGEHSWNNLATILYGFGTEWGENYTGAVAYCLTRRQARVKA